MRSKQIDILRAVAVLLVLGRHANYFSFWRKIGWVGVDLFFVLSGFLISGLLFTEYKRTGEIRIGHFYARRGLKIYPAFWAMLVVTFVGTVASGAHVYGAAYARELLFVQNYKYSVWGHTWSLGVEEHFYLLLPVLLWALAKANRKSPDPFRAMPLLVGAVAVACLGLRLATHAPALQHFRYITPTHLRIDSLFCGVLLGYLHHYRPATLARLPRWMLATAAGFLVLPCLHWYVEQRPMHTLGFTSLYLGFGALLLLALRTPWPRERHIGTLCTRLAYVGSFSYSIYLWHLPVMRCLESVMHLCVRDGRLTLLYDQLYFPVYIAGSVGVGIAAAKLIELPGLRLRERWFPSRSAPVEAQGASRLHVAHTLSAPECAMAAASS